MKQRHKVLTSVSIAAVLVVLCVALALATERLTAPKPDTVATGISATSASHHPAQGDAPTPMPTPEPTPMPTPTPTPEPMPTVFDEQMLVYTQPHSEYYHSVPDCSGMSGAVAWTLESAISVGKQPCPVCLGGEPVEAPEPTDTPVPAAMSAELPVYYTPQGNYYHGDSQCSGMHNAGAHTLNKALADGKERCPVCQPGEPDDIGLFVETFGCDLEELYPGTCYAYTLWDAQTGVCEWTLYCLKDGGKTYGNPVNLEKRTVREGASLPGHVGESLPILSVRTNADNALTVWRRAPEPLHGMLEEAEALLRDMPEMLEENGSTPLEYLTRTVVTFDEGSENVLAVTLWFEGPGETTTFRWAADKNGEYDMTLHEIEGEG